jgi:hypothetical protein
MSFLCFRRLGHEEQKKQGFADAASWITGNQILDAG